MINFSFTLRNPFSNRWDCIKCWSGKMPIKNKHWEVQASKTANIVSFDFRYTIRQDHAGVFVSLGLIGYELIVNCYDIRHWNTEKNRWVNYADPNELKELYDEEHYK